MGIPRLDAIELTFGCHNGRFEFPDHPGPIVILGANGSGKTTLMEALVLTLYGIDLKREPQRLQSRIPWFTELCQASVLLSDDHDERVSVERNFNTQEVTIRRHHDGQIVFRGDGNPAANNAEASRYRRWLAAHIGLEERNQYENTACVNQGELIRTRLGEHLLLIAAGGHRDVAAALAEIEERYYELTQEPLVEGDRRRLRPRQLEEIEQGVADLERRLAEVRAAHGRADPIIREQAALNRELATLSDHLQRLEGGLPVLNERRTLKMERDGLVERVSRLEALQRELGAAQLWLESAQQAWALFGAGPSYPEDFRERTAVLQELWPRRAHYQAELAKREAALARIEMPPAAAALTVCGLLVVAGIASAVAGWPLYGGVAVAMGLLGAMGVSLWRRRVLREWRDAIAAVEEAASRVKEQDDKIDEKLKGMPDADTLGPETVGDRRQRFDTEVKARVGQEDARRRLADALLRALVELHAQEHPSDDADPAAAPAGDAPQLPPDVVRPLLDDPDPAPLIQAARRTIVRLERAISQNRNGLAAKDLELRRALSGPIALPADVPAEAEAAEAALQQRRERRRVVEERLRALEQELWDYGRAPESPVALESQLHLLRARWAACARQVDVYRRAHALVRDAYDEFHTRDQERLIACISAHLTSMTDGVLGPLEAPETLEGVRVMAGGRPLPLESPPLSYGEFHATLLAVRLGAADFLAKTGVRPPFLVDEPFTHLDEERSASVWRLLCAIARDRQVIVATQDRLVLSALGVEPDIVLSRRPVSRSGSGSLAGAIVPRPSSGYDGETGAR